MLCTMCPSIRLSDTHAPGHGWQCAKCREVNCSHYLRCPHCQNSRYEQETRSRAPAEKKQLSPHADGGNSRD